MIDRIDEFAAKLTQYGFSVKRESGMLDFFYHLFPDTNIITYVHHPQLRKMFYFLEQTPKETRLEGEESELSFEQVVEKLDKAVDKGAPKEKVALLFALSTFNYRYQDYPLQSYIELVKLDELDDEKKLMMVFMGVPASDFNLFAGDAPFNLTLELYRAVAHD